MSDASLGPEVDILKGVPIIDQIPALSPLLKLDGTGVFVSWPGPHGKQQLQIQSLRFFGSETSPNDTQSNPEIRMIFIASDDTLEPLGYIEYIIDDDNTGAAVSKCTFHNPSTLMFNEHQETNWAKHGLNPKANIFGGGAFSIAQDWRRFGLGQVLLAASSAVLEKNGVPKFVVYDDASIQYHNPDDKQGGPRNTRVAFKSDPHDPSFVRFQPVTSAYSRYSENPITQYEFTDSDGKFPVNLKKSPQHAYQVPTRLSAMQVTLLTRALNKPTPLG